MNGICINKLIWKFAFSNDKKMQMSESTHFVVITFKFLPNYNIFYLIYFCLSIFRIIPFNLTYSLKKIAFFKWKIENMRWRKVKYPIMTMRIFMHIYNFSYENCKFSKEFEYIIAISRKFHLQQHMKMLLYQMKRMIIRKKFKHYHIKKRIITRLYPSSYEKWYFPDEFECKNAKFQRLHLNLYMKRWKFQIRVMIIPKKIKHHHMKIHFSSHFFNYSFEKCYYSKEYV